MVKEQSVVLAQDGIFMRTRLVIRDTATLQPDRNSSKKSAKTKPGTETGLGNGFFETDFS